MIVTVSGLSGDTNAYRSVLSAVGSCEMSGASAWLEAFACFGCRLFGVRPTPGAPVTGRTARPAGRGLRDFKTGPPPHSSPWGDAGAVCSAERPERFDRLEDSPGTRY